MAGCRRFRPRPSLSETAPPSLIDSAAAAPSCCRRFRPRPSLSGECGSVRNAAWPTHVLPEVQAPAFVERMTGGDRGSAEHRHSGKCCRRFRPRPSLSVARASPPALDVSRFVVLPEVQAPAFVERRSSARRGDG